MVKIYCFFLLFIFTSQQLYAQNQNEQFWQELLKHCNMAYEGQLMTPGDGDAFAGKKLVMHVVNCGENFIHIPFFVGDDKSRTWVLTWDEGQIKLKHDHRHEDGSEDIVTQYGGTSTNTGFKNMQVFPADQETAALIPHAAGNVWWITLDDTSFTYNLRRIGTERLFTVSFDLTKAVTSPGPAWGWEN
jgi:hypothetical protein